MQEETIAKGVVESIGSDGVKRLKDVVTGKFVRSTGDFTPYSVNMHSGRGMGNAATKVLEKIKLEKVLKHIGTNWKSYTLIIGGMAVISGVSLFLFKKRKEKKREKELNKLGFEFINGDDDTTIMMK